MYKIQSLFFVCVKIVGEATVGHGFLVGDPLEADLRVRIWSKWFIWQMVPDMQEESRGKEGVPWVMWANRLVIVGNWSFFLLEVLSEAM